MAFSKIDGFEVTPRRPSSAISRASPPLFSRSRLTKSSHTACPNSLSVLSGLAMILLLARELLLGSRIDVVAGETEFDQKLLKRRRGTEGLHAEDRAAQSGIPLPTESRRLLDRDPPGPVGRPYRPAIPFRLMLEQFPRRHADHPRGDSLRRQLLIDLDAESHLASGGHQDHIR